MGSGRFFGSTMLLLAALAGTGCTAKYKRALEGKEREVRSLRDERDELRAQVDELRGKERLYQEQLAAAPRVERAGATEAAVPLPSGRAAEVSRHLEGTGVETSERGGRIVLTVPASVTFDSGKAVLSSRGKTALRKVSEAIRAEQPGGRVWIEGHTDNEPIKKSPFKSNRHLAVERAFAVAEFLRKEGQIADKRIVVAGHGEWNPVAGNGSADGRARNRRVEILLGD